MTYALTSSAEHFSRYLSDMRVLDLSVLPLGPSWLAPLGHAYLHLGLVPFETSFSTGLSVYGGEGEEIGVLRVALFTTFEGPPRKAAAVPDQDEELTRGTRDWPSMSTASSFAMNEQLATRDDNANLSASMDLAAQRDHRTLAVPSLPLESELMPPPMATSGGPAKISHECHASRLPSATTQARRAGEACSRTSRKGARHNNMSCPTRTEFDLLKQTGNVLHRALQLRSAMVGSAHDAGATMLAAPRCIEDVCHATASYGSWMTGQSPQEHTSGAAPSVDAPALAVHSDEAITPALTAEQPLMDAFPRSSLEESEVPGEDVPTAPAASADVPSPSPIPAPPLLVELQVDRARIVGISGESRPLNTYVICRLCPIMRRGTAQAEAKSAGRACGDDVADGDVMIQSASAPLDGHVIRTSVCWGTSSPSYGFVHLEPLGPSAQNTKQEIVLEVWSINDDASAETLVGLVRAMVSVPSASTEPQHSTTVMNGPQAVVNPFDIMTRGELTARVRIGTHAQLQEDARRQLAASTIQQQHRTRRKLQLDRLRITFSPSRGSPPSKTTAGARPGTARGTGVPHKALTYPTTPCRVVEQPVSWDGSLRVGGRANVDERPVSSWSFAMRLIGLNDLHLPHGRHGQVYIYYSLLGEGVNSHVCGESPRIMTAGHYDIDDGRRPLRSISFDHEVRSTVKSTLPEEAFRDMLRVQSASFEVWLAPLSDDPSGSLFTHSLLGIATVPLQGAEDAIQSACKVQPLHAPAECAAPDGRLARASLGELHVSICITKDGQCETPLGLPYLGDNVRVEAVVNAPTDASSCVDDEHAMAPSHHCSRRVRELTTLTKDVNACASPSYGAGHVDGHGVRDAASQVASSWSKRSQCSLSSVLLSAPPAKFAAADIAVQSHPVADKDSPGMKLVAEESTIEPEQESSSEVEDDSSKAGSSDDGFTKSDCSRSRLGTCLRELEAIQTALEIRLDGFSAGDSGTPNVCTDINAIGSDSCDALAEQEHELTCGTHDSIPQNREFPPSKLSRLPADLSRLSRILNSSG